MSIQNANVNWQTVGFLLIITTLLFSLPVGIGNIILFLSAFAFGLYTLCRMNRKKWDNPAITKQERGRGVILITFYTLMYSLMEVSWVLQGNGELLGDTLDLMWAVLEGIQGVIFLYLLFQVNLELNAYGNKDYHDEGLFTRILKGRFYRQSNWGQKCKSCGKTWGETKKGNNDANS